MKKIWSKMKYMQLEIIQTKIYEIRGKKVMLDLDLAELYGVATKVLNQAVKRNMERFPEDFLIQITRDEYNFLRSQFVTLETGRGKYSKYLPVAFTKAGCFNAFKCFEQSECNTD
jgi:hypothetical protein